MAKKKRKVALFKKNILHRVGANCFVVGDLQASVLAGVWHVSLRSHATYVSNFISTLVYSTKHIIIKDHNEIILLN